MRKFESVDAYLASLAFWKSEVKLLRHVIVETRLAESVKWSLPCYQFDGKNVVGLGAFKSYFGLWFFDGASLADKHAVLVNAQQGKTRAQRQWRMTSAEEIKPRVIKQYINEAIKVVQRGETLKPNRDKPIVVPDVLQAALATDSCAAKAFAEFSKSRQREYAEYIASAKRDATKLSRLGKVIPMIRERVGLNDHYRKESC